MEKTKVLIISSHYLPGFKAGGPIQSVKNIIANLYKEIDFKVLTMDRDMGDSRSYDNVVYNKWVELKKGKVRYIKPEEMSSIKYLRNFLITEDYDTLYLNSSFSTVTLKILLLKKLKLLPKKRIIVAPRGEYSSGAINLKARKKNLFLKISKLIGLYSGIIWQATTKDESKLIEKIHGKNIKVLVAENLKEIKNIEKTITKQPKELKLIFASRISPKKNLKMCIEILKDVDLEGIEFNIVGPIEDKQYWQECQKEMKKLKNVRVNYLGIQPNEELLETLSKHHFFFFPTLGENFGHIILESLIAKTPLIISDQTPWKELEKKMIGWDLKLEKDLFLKILKKCYQMNEVEYNFKLKSIEKYIENYDQNQIIKNNLNLFKKIT